jgi:mannonate dehydratase
MNRREFVAGAGGTMAAAAQSSEGPEGDYKPGRAVMVAGCQRGPTTDQLLENFKRHGIDHCCGYVPFAPKPVPDQAEFDALVERGRKKGVAIDMIALPLSSHYIAKAEHPSIMTGKSPERDQAIDWVCEYIRRAKKAGIPAVKYNLTVLGVLRTEATPGRGGTMLSTWDVSKAKQEPPLTEAGPSPAPVMWERITYFLKRVVPVGNEYKVRLACHPHDPGVPPEGFRGVDRVLGTVEGLKKFLSIEESPYHGLNFCQGTVSEMLEDPGREIFDVIRYFGRRRKIFNVHFRNIRGKRDKFVETFPDEGDVDMVRAMRVYKEVGYPYMMMPDHMPRHRDDPGGHQAFAFGYGYIKALIQAVS